MCCLCVHAHAHTHIRAQTQGLPSQQEVAAQEQLYEQQLATRAAAEAALAGRAAVGNNNNNNINKSNGMQQNSIEGRGTTALRYFVKIQPAPNKGKAELVPLGVHNVCTILECECLYVQYSSVYLCACVCNVT